MKKLRDISSMKSRRDTLSWSFIASSTESSTEPAVFPIKVPKLRKIPANDVMLIITSSHLGGNQCSWLIQKSLHKNKMLISIIDQAGNLPICGEVTIASDKTTQKTGVLLSFFND